MAVILSGLTTSNDGNAYGLLFTASPPWGLILNKFRIYNRWHIRRRKPCQLLVGWKKTPLNIVLRPGFEPSTSRTA